MDMWQSGIEIGHSSEVEEASNDCRLGTLNFDCLEKIIEKLSTSELIKLCTVNPIVLDAVKERAIKKREINFNDWKKTWDTEKVFIEFGEWIKFMRISEEDIEVGISSAFEYFLNLLVNYCTENRLQRLSLHFDIGRINEDLLNAAKPFFTNLRQIHYTSVGHQDNSGQEQLFSKILDAADKLETIQLENTWNRGTWLQHINMQNVQNIALINSSIFDNQSWDAYFKRKPAKVKRFAWINASVPNHKLCEQVVFNCPNLEQIIDIQHIVPDGYLRDSFLMNRYNFISAAENLKCARVTSFTRSGQDLISLFGAIARKNTIENLSIHFLMNAMGLFNYDAYRLDINNTYPGFTSLRRLEIQNNSSCMFWSDIIVHFMRKLINLHEVSISSFESINPVQVTRIALGPPNLKVFKINNASTTVDLKIAIETIGKVKEDRRQNSGEQTITIVINPQQHSYLQGCNVGNNIKIIVV